MLGALSLQVKLAVLGAVVVLLAGTHWKAYHAGKTAVLNEVRAEQLAASETARLREKALNVSNQRIDREYQKSKTDLVARQRVTDDRLREYQAASASSDSPAECRVDDPHRDIANQCAAALVGLDKYAEGVRGKAKALQDYATVLQLDQPPH